MTENQKEQQQDESYSDYPKTDWLLASFVMNANIYGVTVGVTLTVRGNVITGILISNKDYYQKLGEQLTEGVDDSAMVKRIRDQYDELGERAGEQAKAQYKENADKALDQITFIHLDKARILTGGVMLPTTGDVLWRGRLTQVDGFSLGLMSRQDPKTST